MTNRNNWIISIIQKERDVFIEYLYETTKEDRTFFTEIETLNENKMILE